MRLSLSINARSARRGLALAGQRIVAAAAHEIAATAEDVKEGSIDRAPELSGELVDSHRTEIERSTGRVCAVVSAGPAINPKTGTDYSVWMHEGLGDGSYNLGPISEAKNSGRLAHIGDGVGMKFLERSLDHHARTFARRIANAIRRIL